MSKWDREDGGRFKQGCIALLMSGWTPQEVALETGVPEATARYWRDHNLTDEQMMRVRKLRNSELDNSLMELLVSKVRAEAAIMRQFQDKEWLNSQGADSLSVASERIHSQWVNMMAAMQAAQARDESLDAAPGQHQLPPGHPDGPPIDAQYVDMEREPSGEDTS